MKKSELRSLLREEIQKVLAETKGNTFVSRDPNYSDAEYKRRFSQLPTGMLEKYLAIGDKILAELLSMGFKVRHTNIDPGNGGPFMEFSISKDGTPQAVKDQLYKRYGRKERIESLDIQFPKATSTDYIMNFYDGTYEKYEIDRADNMKNVSVKAGIAKICKKR